MVHIRDAARSDLGPLAARLAPLPLFVRYGRSAAQLQESWEAALERKEGFLVAELNGHPCGICWFLAQGTFAAGAYLRTIALAPDAQGQSVGEKLLQAFEQRTAAA